MRNDLCKGNTASPQAKDLETKTGTVRTDQLREESQSESDREEAEQIEQLEISLVEHAVDNTGTLLDLGAKPKTPVDPTMTYPTGRLNPPPPLYPPLYVEPQVRATASSFVPTPTSKQDL
ncbi:Hypothetical predicted protein [Pelobates cultripes]|uniref:Uncharacterized protein n=1 Tax=Pelobates cultripes TaxID=61616 RepID=A0AAD1VUG9_PELCU|nr:Hypothetical predicted protein [Pelobates cultripes]